MLIGPYAPAILRFHFLIPLDYPESLPEITFKSDIFHPLVMPLTTYTHTAGARKFDTASARDEKRLPPGGFSLPHGFSTSLGPAEWRSASAACQGHKNHRSLAPGSNEALELPSSKENVLHSTSEIPSSTRSEAAHRTTVYKALAYMKAAFDDGRLLDDLPFESAVNPGAWKAWRAHRKDTLRAESPSVPNTLDQQDAHRPETRPAIDVQTEATRQPDEWSWNGVWRDRVHKAIDASISAPILYGAGGIDESVSLEHSDS